MARSCKPQQSRFWARVDKNGPTPANRPDLGPCWLWLGATGESYGRFRLGRRRDGMIGAHRWSLEQRLGREIPADKMALHHCDNRPCVNPDHLYEGAHLDNERDKDARGRRPRGALPPHQVRRGEAVTHAKLTVSDVRYIRSRVWVSSKSQSALARELGVAQPTVSGVLKNKTWRHVDDANV